MKKIIFSFMLCILSFYSAQAQGGGIDYDFNPPTGSDGEVNAIAVQPDGMILLAGSFQKYGNATVNRIVRISPDDASRDLTFTMGTGAGNVIQAIALQSDGKILIAGRFNNYDGVVRNKIARLNADGTLDPTFNASIGGPMVYSIVVQPDGKILAVGSFTIVAGNPVGNIARFNADGSPDLSFNMGTGTNDYIEKIVLQPDGKILIGGLFTEYNGAARSGIARLNTDGTIDTSFDPGTGTNEGVGAIAVLDDGKILIAGEFTTYNGSSITRVARLNGDGSLDTGFNPGTGADGYIASMVVQADNKIVVCGFFTGFNGVARNRITRLHADGSQDLSFNPGDGANDAIITCALQADSMILIGGIFTTYDIFPRKSIARINDGCGLVFRVKHVGICDGESYVFNNHTYTESGAYLDTLQSMFGCDSIIISILTVHAAGTFNISKTICEGTSHTVGTHTYTATGTFRDTLQNVGGCDSIIVTQLTVVPTTLDNHQTICQGKSYFLNTSTYTVAGTYTNILPNVGGCDLTITTYLTVTPAPFSNFAKTICQGESYTYNGHVYTSAGLYRDTIDNALGCDSIVITALTIDQPDVSVTQTGTTLSANAVTGSYQWLDADNGYAMIPSANSQSYTPLVGGNYAVEITASNCVDTSAVYAIIHTGVRASSFQKSIQFAPNPVQEYLELNSDPTTSILSVKVLNASGQVVQITNLMRVDVSFLSQGVYLLEVETNQGIWRDRFVK